MSVTKLAVALVASTLAFAITPAFAASPVTEAFLANLTPNGDFLAKSSRLAADTAESASLRAFARTEAAEQATTAVSIDDWTHVQAVAHAATNETADGAVQTGRSVATDEPVPRTAGFLLADTRTPSGADDLDRLKGLNGRAFDVGYRKVQIDALTQIADDYATYIAAGDDPLLLGLAGRELPKVRARIAQLRRG